MLAGHIALITATDPATAGPPTRALIERSGSLHAARTVLGFAATALFLWALPR